MRDFTLVIPTYNRPRELKALLYFLRKDAPWLKFLVLDSSDDQEVAREFVPEHSLIGYPSDAHPFDKFLDGVRRVETPYCMILAEDDVILLDGVAKCVEALKAKPSAVCARGGCFSFTWNIETPDTLHVADGYFAPHPVEQETALERVAGLMAAYHATIYSVNRTETLKWALGGAAKMKTLLGKELLMACLTAVAGQILVLPDLVHGRSMGQSVFPYRDWHPLEMFANHAERLGEEYADYRSRLGFAMVGVTPGMSPEAILRAVDLIHLRYLVQLAPRDVLDFLIERKAKGIKPEGYMSPEAQKSLLNASLSSNTIGFRDGEMAAVFDRLRDYMAALIGHDPCQMAREAHPAGFRGVGGMDSPPA